MFTLDQIRAAHAKVKSGADFPAYVQELKTLGVTAYEHYVSDGHIKYYGGHGIDADAKWQAIPIAAVGSAGALDKALRIHQAGDTDYRTFCAQAADAGVDSWTVSMEEMRCTYYDKGSKPLLIEEIPLPADKA